MHWKNKVVIITGATSGIGEATAKRFGREGAVLLLAARSRGKLEALATELQGGGTRAVAQPTDVTVPAQLDALVERALREFGRIDILINNAGVGLFAPVETSREEAVRAMFETNFFAPLRAARAVIPAMRQQGGGQIINVSSVVGLIALPLLTTYSATKFALNALTDGLRAEVADDGIDVISVCPGRVKTSFQENVLQNVIREDRSGGIGAERVAEAILKASRRRKRLVVVPAYLKWGIAVANALPALKEWGRRQMWRRAAKKDA